VEQPLLVCRRSASCESETLHRQRLRRNVRQECQAGMPDLLSNGGYCLVCQASLGFQISPSTAIPSDSSTGVYWQESETPSLRPLDSRFRGNDGEVLSHLWLVSAEWSYQSYEAGFPSR
jgi:hypothetical protein